MFSNIGKKIKGVALFFFTITIIIFVIGAFVLFGMSGNAYFEELQAIYATGGFACLILGPVIAWLSSLFLYGFGELIDKTQDIAEQTKAQHSYFNRIETARKLLDKGAITKEEYNIMVR